MFYRLRNAWWQARFRYQTRAIASTRPVACASDASCELHTMLSQRDFHMYLVAIKSMLRWQPRTAVVVHSDGSLDQQAAATLQHHVPGLRFISFEQADARAGEALRDRPGLARWRTVDMSYRRMVDTALWSRTPRRIIMDGDVLVLRRPDEVLRWMESGTTPFLMGQTPASEPSLTPPPPGAHIQHHFRHALPQIAARLGWPPRFLHGTTGGFHGCCADELSLDRVERLLAACEGLGLPMTQWGGEQCAVIYLLSTTGAERLDERRYFNFEPALTGACADATFVHFYGTYRFHDGLYPRLAAKVCRELSAAGPNATVGR